MLHNSNKAGDQSPSLSNNSGASPSESTTATDTCSTRHDNRNVSEGLDGIILDLKHCNHNVERELRQMDELRARTFPLSCNQITVAQSALANFDKNFKFCKQNFDLSNYNNSPKFEIKTNHKDVISESSWRMRPSQDIPIGFFLRGCDSADNDTEQFSHNFQKALSACADKHNILKTSFSFSKFNQTPRADLLQMPIEIIEASSIQSTCSRSILEKDAVELATQFYLQGFKMEITGHASEINNAPTNLKFRNVKSVTLPCPIRVLIVNNLQNSTKLVQIVVNHIAFDGRSIEPFLQDLSGFYQNLHNQNYSNSAMQLCSPDLELATSSPSYQDYVNREQHELEMLEKVIASDVNSNRDSVIISESADSVKSTTASDLRKTLQYFEDQFSDNSGLPTLEIDPDRENVMRLQSLEDLTNSKNIDTPKDDYVQQQFEFDATSSFFLNSITVSQLKQCTQILNITEAQLMQGLFGILLMKHHCDLKFQNAEFDACRQVILGIPFCGRRINEDDLIGFYANTLPLNLEVEQQAVSESDFDSVSSGSSASENDTSTLQSYFQQVSVKINRLLDRQKLPFLALAEKILTKFNGPDTTSTARTRSAIFQSMVLFENELLKLEKEVAIRFGAQEIEVAQISKERFSPVEISLFVTKNSNSAYRVQTHQQADIDISYDCCIVSNYASRSFVDRIAFRFQEIVKSLAHQCLNNTTAFKINPLHLNSIPEYEQHLLQYQYQDVANNFITDIDINKTISFMGRIRRAVQNSPSAIAIEYDDEQCTYQQMWQRSAKVRDDILLKDMNQNQDKLDAGDSDSGNTNYNSHSNVVALCIERSIEQVIAVLGILRAGKAYLPLDPEHPPERIRKILEKCKVQTVVVVDRLFSGGSNKSTVQEVIPTSNILGEHGVNDLNLVWVADTNSHNLCKLKSESDSYLDNLKDELCYVLFTSGTSGEPKGVAVPHKAVTNRMLWMQERCIGLKGSDAMLRKAPLQFDVSVWEMLWPLMVGAKVVFYLRGHMPDAQILRPLIKKRNITVLHFVPSLFDTFLAGNSLNNLNNDQQSESESELAAVHTIFASGEALKKSTVEKARQQFPNLKRLFNWYGPTEGGEVTSIECLEYMDSIVGSKGNIVRALDTHSNLTTSDSDSNTTDINTLSNTLLNQSPYIPIGRPIANTQIYIVDPITLKAVPPGVVGELCISGSALADGYYGDVEKTKQKFLEVQDPTIHHDISNSTTNGSENNANKIRLYRTGDVARYEVGSQTDIKNGATKNAGIIHFLGRMDDQVKIGGIRIEPQEVASLCHLTMKSDDRDRIFQQGIEPICIIHKETNNLALFYAPALQDRVSDTSDNNTNTSDTILTEIDAYDLINNHLQKHLPTVMVPHWIFRLQGGKIPYTRTGKLDIRVLNQQIENYRLQKDSLSDGSTGTGSESSSPNKFSDESNRNQDKFNDVILTPEKLDSKLQDLILSIVTRYITTSRKITSKTRLAEYGLDSLRSMNIARHIGIDTLRFIQSGTVRELVENFDREEKDEIYQNLREVELSKADASRRSKREGERANSNHSINLSMQPNLIVPSNNSLLFNSLTSESDLNNDDLSTVTISKSVYLALIKEHEAVQKLLKSRQSRRDERNECMQHNKPKMIVFDEDE